MTDNSTNCRLNTVKEIHDNIWGTIRITETELDVLDHPLLQRLRRISQLGLVNMVYPSSGHSRLAHSLGVLALANQVGRHLCEIGDLTRDEFIILRLAALVHDVGHYPLSHSTEDFYIENDGKEAKHETFGAYLIRSTSLGDKIDSVLKDTGWNRDDVADIIQGRKPNTMEKPAIWQLINSQFDLDKMDYLMRDCTAVGLDYGRIDFSRILSKIVVDPEQFNIGIDIRASTAIENYILARYYLYDVVYLHKAVMGFEILQIEICKSMNNVGIFPCFDEIKEMVEKETYCEFDDNYFWKTLYDGIQKDEKIRVLGEMLRDRQPLKLAYEAPGPQDPLLSKPQEELSKARPYAEDSDIVEGVPSKCGIPPEWYFPKRVDIAIHEFLPLVEPELYDPAYDTPREKAKEIRAKTIRLFNIGKSGEKKFAGFLASNPQSVMFPLSTIKKQRFRFYTHDDHKEKLQEFLKLKIKA
jgi:HD superfamily phosphohydrolase